MLHINDLHVAINDKEVLRGINLTIPDHEVHALFGPNGSGKSVLISTIMGYPEYRITQGEIFYNGKKLNDMAIEERVKSGISALEQRPPVIKGVKLGNLTNIMVQNNPSGHSTVSEIAEQFGMDRFLSRDINDGFSGGEIKKSEIFLLITAQPDFIILDEPDSGVDPEHLRLIGKMINKSLSIHDLPGQSCKTSKRKSGLIATHSASVLDYVHTDKAHILVDGVLKCSGNPSIMMDQIREYGYAYCIKCQQSENEM